MTRQLIKTDGTVTDLSAPLTVAEISAMIGAEILCVVNLHDGNIMLVNDIGIELGLPANAIATTLYHSVCIPGTTNQILGDVVVAPDADFGDHDNENAPA